MEPAISVFGTRLPGVCGAAENTFGPQIPAGLLHIVLRLLRIVV